MAEALKASPRIVNDYLGLFVNRRAYTMQSIRPHPENGPHYYFRPTKKNSQAPLALTKETIRRHLEGEITIGLLRSIPLPSARNGLRSTPTTSTPWKIC